MTVSLLPAHLRLDGAPLPLLRRGTVYVCGVTPYDVTHLGHAATFVWVDALSRVLRHLGVDVELARNVTDVDDVLTAAAERAGERYDRFAAVQLYQVDRDMSALGVRRPQREPRAHQHVDGVIAMADALVASGSAYVRGGSVYFRGAEVAARAGLDVEAAIALAADYGGRIDDPAKEHPLDVAIWQASDAPGEPAWESPWGPGRPGWHAGCAAMVVTGFGPSVDVHGGGADLRFPHHAYEAAIAEAVTGVAPFARRWLHVGVVTVDGAKMAKSTGNLVLVADLLQRYPASAIRLGILDRPWGAGWDYDRAVFERAAGRLDALYAAAGLPGGSAAGGNAVIEALLDDLDVSRAIDVALEAGGTAARTLTAILDLT